MCARLMFARRNSAFVFTQCGKQAQGNREGTENSRKKKEENRGEEEEEQRKKKKEEGDVHSLKLSIQNQ